LHSLRDGITFLEKIAKKGVLKNYPSDCSLTHYYFHKLRGNLLF
jgi:hypothetical protein